MKPPARTKALALVPVAWPAAETSNVENELIDNPNGTETLRLEGNDSATFVDGELVDERVLPVRNVE